MSDQPAMAIEAARNVVRRLFDAAVAAVEPATAVRAALERNAGTLNVGSATVPVRNGVHIVAVGKAAVAMTRGALDVVGEIVVSGDVITKDGHVDSALPDQIRVFEAGHPIPDQRGVNATEQMLDALHQLAPEVVVLALISGGGSALLEAPREGVTLGDFATTTDLLLRAGAPIGVLNAVRSPLSQVKSGGLRASAPEYPWVTLILSDVLGNDPRVIASGPTVPADRNSILALQYLADFQVRDLVPRSVVTLLERDESTTEAPVSAQDVMTVIGDNAAAIDAAANEAAMEGLRGQVVWRGIEGEAAELGREFVAAVEDVGDSVDLLLGGGEATVTVRGSGRGGRNTEFALAAALELERRGLDDWVVASLATDGQDALTGLAGAIGDADTGRRARDRGIDPLEALIRNDSQCVFEAAGGEVETGPTGTNVNDLYFALRLNRTTRSGAGKGV
jgi:glycerate 2-kinase